MPHNLSLIEQFRKANRLLRLAGSARIQNIDFTPVAHVDRPIMALASDSAALEVLKNFIETVPEELSSLIRLEERPTNVPYGDPMNILNIRERGIQL